MEQIVVVRGLLFIEVEFQVKEYCLNMNTLTLSFIYLFVIYSMREVYKC